jgi:hypothetical protein
MQSSGIREFLGVDYPNSPTKSKRPIPKKNENALREFVLWAFGTSEKGPVLTDSRDITKFGKILESSEALRYLRSAPRPTLERAWLKSGGQKESLVESLYAAADRLEESAALTPQHGEESEQPVPEVSEAIDRCALFMAQILRDFPTLRTRHFGKG